MATLLPTTVLADALPRQYPAVPAELTGPARISHQPSAAADDAPRPATSSHLGVLDVLSSFPPATPHRPAAPSAPALHPPAGSPPLPSDRTRHSTRHLVDLVTNAGERCGLVCRASELRRATPRGRSHTPTLPALDELLGGGLPGGAVVEVVGRASCGRLALLLAALAAVTSAGEPVALVDLGDGLDPQAAAAAGIDLERLLWLRPHHLRDTLAAAEMLVDTGFPLVALDLGLPPVRGRVPLAAWLRLARGAGARQATVLISSPYRLSGCAAEVVVVARRGRGAWSGAHGSRRLLDGLALRLVVVKRRGERPEATAEALLLHPDVRRSESIRPAVPTTLSTEVHHA